MSERITNSQRDQIEALLAHISTFPTQELIVVSSDLRLPRPIDDRGRRRMRQIMAGAFAFGKITYYMQALRSVDAERDRLGREIASLHEQVAQLRANDPIAAIHPETLGVGISGMQEVTFHFFAICVMRILRLWELVGRAAGYTLSAADTRVLDSFRPLRNYFEHMETEANAMVGIEADGHLRFSFGFESDDRGRIIINGQTVDVTTRGLDAIEEIIQRNYDRVRASCLDLLRNHFVANPNDIPSPDEVPYPPLVSVQRTQ